MKNIRYLEDVSTLAFNKDKCVGCGLCTVVCPHQVFEMNDGKAVIVDLDGCMECGACVNNCPVNAIEVNPGVG
ncbi:MAG: 4Fe-4S binding protein [Desulfamplus sp.]|nr:4Fe-4S binding protein [Desulfamplus sp.]